MVLICVFGFFSGFFGNLSLEIKTQKVDLLINNKKTGDRAEWRGLKK